MVKAEWGCFEESQRSRLPKRAVSDDAFVTIRKLILWEMIAEHNRYFTHKDDAFSLAFSLKKFSFLVFSNKYNFG